MILNKFDCKNTTCNRQLIDSESSDSEFIDSESSDSDRGIIYCDPEFVHSFHSDLPNSDLPKFDFSDAFDEAALLGSNEICQYFIDKEVSINYNQLSHCNSYGLLNVKIFTFILNQIGSKNKKVILESIEQAILNKNKELIEYLFKQNAKRENSLYLAAQTNDLDIINIALKYYKNNLYNINYIDNKGTALSIAVRNNNLEIVKLLLSYQEIDPNLYNLNKNNEIEFPLLIAIRNNNLDIVNCILSFYGDNIKYQKNQLKLIMKEIFNLYQKYRYKSKFHRIIQRILEIKYINPNEIYKYSRLEYDEYDEYDEHDEHDEYVEYNIEEDEYGKLIYLFETFLCKACDKNDIDIVKCLLNLDNIDVNKYNPKNGNTPLIIAVCNQNIEIVNLLLMNPNINVNHKNFEQENAFDIAYKKKYNSIIEVLINNDKFDQDLTFLNHIQDRSLIKIFIQSKHFNANCYDISLLKEAIRNKDNEIIDILIDKLSISNNIENINEAAYFSIKYNSIETFKKLEKMIDINLCYKKGDSFLIIAASKFKNKFIDSILNNENFDSKKSCLCKVFNNFYSQINEDSISSFFKIEPKKIRLIKFMNKIYNYDKNHDHLIDLTKLIPKENKSLFTAISCENGYEINNITNYLLENGVDPNVPDENNVYPLEKAIKSNFEKLILALIHSNKIDYSVKIHTSNDDSFTTYLHLATKYCNEEIVNEFLNIKLININIEDSDGNTPLMIASMCRKDYLFDLFFDKDDLDYLHCNKNGEDALDLRSSEKIENREELKDKNKYLEKMKLFEKRMLFVDDSTSSDDSVNDHNACRVFQLRKYNV